MGCQSDVGLSRLYCIGRATILPAWRAQRPNRQLIGTAKWGIGSCDEALGVYPGRKSFAEDGPMKVRNSLKSLRARHRANQLVRRRGRVYIINKVQKRYKARQG